MINIYKTETIAALATPAGKGGVGVVRVSGPLVPTITKAIVGAIPQERYATFCNFLDKNQNIIDQGLVIYFCAPNSFTGEDVLELHGHGGSVIMDLLLRRVLELGARLAEPGEFTKRAFLNQKIDLSQAEAVADLINATTTQAAQNAVRSLQGEFSNQANKLVELLTQTRLLLEATIDFPEEEETTTGLTRNISAKILKILDQIQPIKKAAKQGMLLRDGITVVIVGKPNAGKSSLFNYLCGQEKAIVTNIPGTTRDILQAQIQLDGLPINLLDTAGLREQPDIIEEEGIRRAWEEIKKADHVLLLVDATTSDRNVVGLYSNFSKVISPHARFTVLYNKIDLSGEEEKVIKQGNIDSIFLSVKTQQGLDLLVQHLKQGAGFCVNEGNFSARTRHLKALEGAEHFLQRALVSERVECVAEDLMQAQKLLGEITGAVTPDDLLDKIFSEFCLGK